MKTALTVWEDRISPVFDSAGMLLIVDVDKGGVARKQYRSLDCGEPVDRVRRLVAWDIGVLICGAISELPAKLIEARSIELISFITGSIDRVVDAYLQGDLLTDQFLMPGYRPEKKPYPSDAPDRRFGNARE